MAEILSRIELSETFLTQGIQDTHFFNGRLLTAGDLETMQEASRKRDVQLGQAAGAGVVSGLEVKLVADGSDGKPPVLAVSCGLAYNRLGQAVALPVDTEVSLAKEKPVSAQDQSLFEACQPPQTGGKPLPGKGAYLFVARPAIELSGLAPRRGFGQAAKVEGCDRALLQDGVQFRLVPFDINKLDKLSPDTRTKLTTLLTDVGKFGSAGLAAQNKLRNWLAHACFGTEELSAWPVDPFPSEKDDFLGPAQVSSYLAYGLLDQLERQALSDDCDIPLALVCWTTGGVKWVDMWSVRRRPMRSPLPLPWPIPGSERRTAETEAAFLQFQDHVTFMTRPTVLPFQLSQVRAVDNFRHLPPAGFIPVGGVSGSRGFNPLKFFEGLVTRSPVFNTTTSGSNLIEPLVIEGAALEAALKHSFSYPAIDLVISNTTSEVLIWVYAVRENKMAIDQVIGSSPQPYLFFTSGHMPYLAESRYNLNRWNYSNYS